MYVFCTHPAADFEHLFVYLTVSLSYGGVEEPGAEATFNFAN